MLPLALQIWCYVQVEAGTPFARWYSGQDSPLPQEPDAVAMFEAASATLTAAGYEHYEVSRPSGHHLRHRLQYSVLSPSA
jgi:oxygen-independent coproporphyrinogen-3 oxidase